jgi:hypothetical protein
LYGRYKIFSPVHPFDTNIRLYIAFQDRKYFQQDLLGISSSPEIILRALTNEKSQNVELVGMVAS